jgi:hypothetical protein
VQGSVGAAGEYLKTTIGIVTHHWDAGDETAQTRPIGEWGVGAVLLPEVQGDVGAAHEHLKTAITITGYCRGRGQHLRRRWGHGTYLQ